MHASDVWIDKLAMFISQRCALCCWYAVFQRCCHSQLPPVHRLPPGGDPWYERRDFSCDLLPPSTGKMFVWPPAILSEPGSARYSSTPSLTTVWSNYETLYNDFFEIYITKTVTLSPNVQTVLWPVYLSRCKSRDQSFFVLIGQSSHCWRIPFLWP